jgi:hypothetical protein
MRALLLPFAGILTAAAMAPPVQGTAEEFGAATTACFDAQQSVEPDQAKISARGFEQDRPPAGWEDKVGIFHNPGTAISITVGRQESTCAVSWVAQPGDDPALLTKAVTDAILEAAARDFAGRARTAPPAVNGAQTRFQYMVGDSFGTLIATVEGTIVQFQFVAINRSRVRAPSAG